MSGRLCGDALGDLSGHEATFTFEPDLVAEIRGGCRLSQQSR
jgi:hypothetical protein